MTYTNVTARIQKPSDKPSDYGLRQWQTERDTLGHRHPPDVQ